MYYYSSHKGRQKRMRIEAPTRDAIAGVLGDLRDVIANGQFVRTPDANDCRFCDYAAACGGEVNRQAKEKLPESRLAAYGRLTAHV
jgi:ATP-dependent helicase/nuclease subunit B